jgi:hypothetical protein
MFQKDPETELASRTNANTDSRQSLTQTTHKLSVMSERDGNPQKDTTSEDWMQVLDNFLDNNDEGNHMEHQQPHQQQQQQQQQHNQAHARAHHTHAPNSTSSQTAIATAAAAAAAGSEESRTNPPPPAAAAMALSSSAHSINNDNLDATDLSEEVKTEIRSERKRTREKQRRSDVNAQFAALTEILKRVEGYDLDSDVSDDEENDTTCKKQKLSTTVPVMNATPSNRVDLISRTISIMDRLHKVNRSLRQTVKGLRKSLKKMNCLEDDLKKPGMMNSGGMPFGQNGQFPGMMMMMPPGMQQMGMMGGAGGGGMPQQGDQQVRELIPTFE